jgi:glycosyltransferase involved in cell wall biosynthesis
MVTHYPLLPEDERLGGIMQASFRLVCAIDALADPRIRLHVLTQSEHIAERTVKTLPNGTTITFVPAKHVVWDKLLFGYPAVARAVAAAVGELSPDLLHGQGTAKYIYAAINGGVPHIITIHGIAQNEMKVVRSELTWGAKLARWAKIRLERHYVTLIKNLIAITPEVSSYVLSAAPTARVFDIDNTLDEEFFSIPALRADSPPTVLFVAAITFRKGLDYLLEAFARIRRRLPNARLRIAGIWDWDPVYVSDLRSEYADLIDEGAVVFLGGITQDQLIVEMTNARVLCLPSRAESAPMVISQAMAAGRAVVASNVGGIPSMVEDGVNGRLCEVGDVDALTHHLDELLSDPELCATLGGNGRTSAMDRYSSHSVATKTVDAYIRAATTR